MKETPFYLVHGWDAQSMLRAMSLSRKRGSGRKSAALTWRRDVNRQHEIGLAMAKEYQAAENKRRAKEHSDALSGLEKAAVPEFAYELELPDRSGYRFYPVVLVLRLKAVSEFPSRPRTRLTQDVTEESRLDFDEELLPEDSWEPDRLAGEFEVEAILDDRMPLSTSTERSGREFIVKWVGFDGPTWEPASNLSCGGLLYDYLRAKKCDRRLQMVQVADED
ncbi:hypothetical protein PC110_g4314 [Phytophthora cactorum]|uniref:Chromo domain-containing protein n=1 Tax=Phytophthora cactorum TaxID=29920 RepID=A0A329SSB8_9STRA|nr:hypothetical protein PC110_g4314 [Phytophthora cactorum]